MREDRMTRLTYISIAFVILSALILGGVYFKNVLLLQDGGWYTYPAYALHMGGDPSENMPGYEISRAHPGVTAKFIWENRTNLFVLHQWLGMSIFGVDWAALRVYGGIQWLLLAGISALIAGRLTRSKFVGAIVGGLVLADSVLIGAAFSDARPDVINALLAILIFGLMEWMVKSESFLAFILACLGSICLSLMHVTSAIAIALLCVYISVTIWDKYRATRHLGRTSVYLGLVALILCVVYLFRIPIINLILPTQVPAAVELAGQHSLIAKLKHNFGEGAHAKLMMERARWYGYFFVKNLSQLLLLLAGGLALLSEIKNTSIKSKLAKRLAFSVLMASIFQLLTDPHGTVMHLIVLMVFGYLASVLAIFSWMENHPEKTQKVIGGIALLMIATFVLKLGQCYKVNRTYANEGFTNETVETALRAVLKDNGGDQVDIKILGPTEIWPYLVGRGPGKLTIVDIDRTKVPNTLDQVFTDGITMLVVNEDYWTSGWDSKIKKWLSEGAIVPVVQFGQCGVTSPCVGVYRQTKQ